MQGIARMRMGKPAAATATATHGGASTWARTLLLSFGVAGLLLLCGGTRALAACAETCSAESSATGLAHPPGWTKGRSLHFEPRTSADSAYPAHGIFGGSALLAQEAEGSETLPLLFHPSGVGVQHNPRVYAIFWGSNWNEEPGAALRSSMMKLYEGFTGSAYQGVLTQYFDATGRISSNVTATGYTDTGVTAPSAVNEAAIENEVAKAITANGWTSDINSQFVVITAPGSTYESSFASGFCAYHGVTAPGGAVYAFVPYQGDKPFSEGCLGTDRERNPSHKTMKSASHEYAEAATNPKPGSSSSWVASNGSEIGDLCQTEFDLELPDGAWAQNEWDDHQNTCSHEDLEPPHVYAVSETASELGSGTAKLNGTVNPEALETHYHFEYGTTVGYGSVTSEVSAGSGTSNKAAGQVVSGLSASTEYHFRVVATNSTGTTAGKDRTFKTTTPIPLAETKAASSIGDTEATLNGIVNPRGFDTHYYFEYGPTTSFGSKTPEVDAGAGIANLEVAATIASLTPGATYKFRLVATNVHGTSDGKALSVKTHLWSLQAIASPEGELSSGPQLEDLSCATTTSCDTAGWYANGSGTKLPLAESWNGTEWRLQSAAAPEGSQGSSLAGISCAASTACTAAGSYVNGSGIRVTLAETWNGVEWKVQATPNPEGAKESELLAVSCATTTACTATGSYVNGSGIRVTLAATWNGVEWKIQSTPNPEGAKESQLTGVSCASAKACEASGSYVNGAGVRVALAESLTSTTWKVQAVPNPAGASETQLRRVSCASTKFCVAAGAATNAGAHEAVAESWNGTEWKLLSPPLPEGATEDEFLSVSCPSATLCRATGTTLEGGIREPYATGWTGSEWSVQTPATPEGAQESELRAVECPSTTTCLATGSYRTSTGVRRTLAEKHK